MHQSPVRASLNTIEITALFIKRVCQGKPRKLKLNIKIVKKKRIEINMNKYFRHSTTVLIAVARFAKRWRYVNSRLTD